jgi:large subunit ribosomal protein L9
MKVILNQDVPNLGEEGDVCEVARGYARNYLIPRGMVLLYNKRNSAAIEERRAAIERRKEEKRKAAMSTKERLESEELVFTMATGEKGKLFGSVSSQAIAERLERMGVDVERKKIDVPGGTIKALGSYTATVKLYGGEEAQLAVRVRSENEAQEEQSGAGSAAAAEAATEQGSEDASQAASADSGSAASAQEQAETERVGAEDQESAEAPVETEE